MTTTNALDLIPAFRRQINVYTQGSNTADSALAGYIADSVQALESLWDKGYTIEFISPATYYISPELESKDIRPIILMASIIYKMGAISLTSFTDGDFTWNARGSAGLNAITMDREELVKYIAPRLAGATVGTLYGFEQVYNPESYSWWSALQYVLW